MTDLSDDELREIFLAHGFMVKADTRDLKPYVYAAARALIEEDRARNYEAPANTLRDRMQQQCCDWGTYWRASDAHGVNLTAEQATDLLRDALGVEVEIKALNAAAGEAEPVAWMRPSIFDECAPVVTAEPDIVADWRAEGRTGITPLYVAQAQQAAPVAPAEHVGDSQFETWFSTYSPAGKGDKHRARDAYAAGMGDPGSVAQVERAGWRWVPVEPTEAMLRALDGFCFEQFDPAHKAMRVMAYRSLLAASPHPAPEPTDQQQEMP